MIAKFQFGSAEYRRKLPSELPELKRLDTGIPVPNDGHRYFMVRHAIDYLGYVRNQSQPVPAVAHKGWGTTVSDNKDYLFVSDTWQRFFYDFIDAMSFRRLADGEFIGYYTIKKNPGLLFHNYTPGTKKWIYSRMYQDAVWATDAGSFTTGARDSVLGLNTANSEVWQYLSGRPTTGAILRLQQERGSVLRFDCLDSKKLPPDPYNLPIHQYQPDGSVTRFGQYKQAFQDAGIDFILGSPSPLIAPDGWLEMKRDAVIELAPGSLWSPYRTAN